MMRVRYKAYDFFQIIVKVFDLAAFHFIPPRSEQGFQASLSEIDAVRPRRGFICTNSEAYLCLSGGFDKRLRSRRSWHGQGTFSSLPLPSSLIFERLNNLRNKAVFANEMTWTEPKVLMHLVKILCLRFIPILLKSFS